MRGLLPALLIAACGDTGQVEVAYPIAARGEATPPFPLGEWTVTLERARLGFGPAYFCANAAPSSDLCPTAVQEYRDSREVDLLDATPQAIGVVEGVSGTIRSVSFDLGISWFATAPEPKPTAGAPRGVSCILAGFAARAGERVDFEFELVAAPHIRGERASVERVEATIDDSRARLDVIFPVRALFDQPIDFSRPLEEAAYNGMVIALTTNAPPSFVWSAAESSHE